ncbi:hypothetical protein FBU59_005472, partial [Linderina macrospora]
MSFQSELGGVRNKLKGLWSQYSNSGTTTSDNTGQRSGEPPAPVEEILLFPTYAYRDERLKVWRVQVRGWAYQRNVTSTRVRLAASAMRKLIGMQKGDKSDQVLLDRISYLFAGSPVTTELVQTAMTGISEPQAFELYRPVPGTQNQGTQNQGKQPPPKPPRAMSGRPDMN